MQGDFAEARRLYSEARAIYDELGLSSLRAMRSLVPASIEMLAGNPDAAERELRWGYDTLATMGERGIRSTLAAFLAEVLYAQGRLDEAEDLSRVSEEAAAEDDLVTQTIWRTARAKVLARRGDVETAERLADEAKALAEGTDFPDLQATALLALAEVLRASGETTEAEPLIEAARATYRRKGNVVAADRTAQVLAAAT
jgi:ATP/maltotriose-dependent transcriptional regulator MalT